MIVDSWQVPSSPISFQELQQLFPTRSPASALPLGFQTRLPTRTGQRGRLPFVRIFCSTLEWPSRWVPFGG